MNVSYNKGKEVCCLCGNICVNLADGIGRSVLIIETATVVQKKNNIENCIAKAMIREGFDAERARLSLDCEENIDIQGGEAK